VAPLEQSSPAAGDAQRSTQTAQALLSLGAPVMCLLVVEPQISMGKVARTNVAVIRKVIATPSKIH
jgi:hypothetical protein